HAADIAQDVCRTCKGRLGVDDPHCGTVLTAKLLEVQDVLNALKDKPLFRQLYALQETSGRPRLEEDTLQPLSTWRNGIGHALDRAFETIGGVLEGRQDTSADDLNRLAPAHVHKLHSAYRAMEKAGYTQEMALHGATTEAKTS